MSYFPARSVPDIVQSTKAYAVFTGRVELGVGARGSVASPTTYTTAAFTVPTLVGSSVTVSVNATTNFLAGDLVLIGTRAGVLATPASPGSGAGAVTLSGRYQQGYAGGETISGTGWHFIAPNGNFTTNTVGGFTLPNATTFTSTSITVANRSNIPASSYVLLSNYAGVYQVTGSTASTLTLSLVSHGDIPPGGTCIVDGTRSSFPGSAVAQFWPLGVVPKGFIFSPYSFGFTALNTSAGAGTANISVGWIPNNYGVNPTTRLGEWINNTGVQSGTTMSPNKSLKVSIKADDRTRLSALGGATFGVRVNVPGGSAAATYTVLASIEGLLTPIV